MGLPLGGPMKTPTPYHQCTPAEQENIRREVVERLSRGHRVAALARQFHVSRQTLYDWRDAAQSPGGLARRPMGPPCALTDEQLARLRQMLLEGARLHGFATDMWTLERIRQLVAKTFGVRYAPRSLWHVLRARLNFSPQKPERQAREADPEEIAAWKKKFRRRGKKGAA